MTTTAPVATSTVAAVVAAAAVASTTTAAEFSICKDKFNISNSMLRCCFYANFLSTLYVAAVAACFEVDISWCAFESSFGS